MGLVSIFVVFIFFLGFPFDIIFRSIFFALGVLVALAGFWGLYEAKRLSLEDYIPSPEAVLFAQQNKTERPYFTYVVTGCLIAVFLVQLSFGLDESFLTAGLVKHAVWQDGQWWRLITGATLHSIILHIYFNGQAFFVLGSMIEYFSNRSHLAIVFLLAVVGGGLMSLFLMPNINSIGASGGVMGLIGYLAIYGYRRKRQLPPGFLKNILVNVGLIAAMGVIAYQFIDNAAHLGGFLVGAAYGFMQIPGDVQKDPRQANDLTVFLGYAALVIFIAFCALSILLITKTIYL